MKMTDAEKAYEVAVARKDTGSPREAFMAGRASRDAEVAELRAENTKLRKQVAEAQATIEKVRDWNEKYGTLTLGEILSAPSSTGGN
jgi:hypothetical protein